MTSRRQSPAALSGLEGAATAGDARLDLALVKLAGIVVAGALAPLLDTTMLSVAVNDLDRRFGVSLASVQWVNSAYLLAMAAAIPLTGWSVRRFGTRAMWLSVLAVFAVGSALCGLAWSLPGLIAFRVVQGLAGGMILPLAQTIMAQAAGPRLLGRAMALVAVPGQFAPVIGPVLGGALIDSAGWRWVFYVNVPVVACALLLAWGGLRGTRPPGRPRLDVAGLALLTPGLTALVYGLSQVGRGASAGAGLAAGVVLLAVFTRHSLRRLAGPLLDLRLLGVRSFALVAVLTLLSGASIFGPMFLLPLYFQRVGHLSAAVAGLMLAPQGAGTALALPAAGRLTDRLGTRPVALAGLALTAVATVAFAVPSAGRPVQAAALLVRGMGLGTAGIAMMAGAYQGLPPARVPDAAGLISVIQRIGGSGGVAVLAVLLQRASAGTASPAAAFGDVFWWAVGFALISFLPAWLLRPAAGPAATGQGD